MKAIQHEPAVAATGAGPRGLTHGAALITRHNRMGEILAERSPTVSIRHNIGDSALISANLTLFLSETRNAV